MQRVGGTLNYNERMRELGARAADDFVEVASRLNAIALGLNAFYAVTDPSENDLDDNLSSARTRIEGAACWLRKATNALARAKMDEQQCVIRLTIEGTPEGRLLDKLEDGLVISFQNCLLGRMRNSRLSGLTATTESLLLDAWVDIEVTSPAQVLSKSEVILPPVMLRMGRVTTASSLPIRDKVGGRPLLNRSPVGDWIVKCVRNDRGASLAKLHLDFFLSFV